MISEFGHSLYRTFVRVILSGYFHRIFISANLKPFRIAFGFVFCGYENFIVHNCEMKKSFNFDKVSFLSEQPEKSTDFLSSFLETQVGFHESYLHLNPSVESKVPNPLVEATKILWFGGSIQLKFSGIFYSF